MKLTSYGKKEWTMSICIFIGYILFLILFLLLHILSLLTTVILCFFGLLACVAACAFFRDPERIIPNLPNIMLAPADGMIRDIEMIKGEDIDSAPLKTLFEGKNVIRIGIFLSVFNVHLNRAPWEMKVSFKEYKPGRYLDARNKNASKENESMLIGGIALLNEKKFPIAVRQISGAIARRIVCPVQPDDVLPKGFAYGMIKFGSRTELYIPCDMDFNILVKIGEPVTAGITPMVEIPDSTEKKLSLLNMNLKQN